jgi:hypothetical protein
MILLTLIIFLFANCKHYHVMHKHLMVGGLKFWIMRYTQFANTVWKNGYDLDIFSHDGLGVVKLENNLYFLVADGKAKFPKTLAQFRTCEEIA